MSAARKIAGGFWGLLVGDAAGVPYEFKAPHQLPPRAQLGPTPPAGFHRSWEAVPVGTWSDDGAHALCLTASLLACGRLDVDDLAARLLRWQQEGYAAVGGVVFDIGAQTSRALANLRQGVPATEAGPSGERDNGNGSLMRSLPLALWHRGTDAELLADAELQSRVTHGHRRARVACAIYCLWARRLLQGHHTAWDDAVATAEAIWADDAEALHELRVHLLDGPAPRGSGYVADSLRSARHAFHAGPYADVIRAAIALGEDTDTTACIAGGVAGIRDGIEAIPEDWLMLMRGRAFANELLDGLLARPLL